MKTLISICYHDYSHRCHRQRRRQRRLKLNLKICQITILYFLSKKTVRRWRLHFQPIFSITLANFRSLAFVLQVD